MPNDVRSSREAMMPRLPRLVVSGVPMHVVQRGNNRAATFRSADDFAGYRDTLSAASQQYACAIHAYVLMTNHVHLLVTPSDEQGPSRLMQAVGRRYVRCFNARYRRTGTLWEGRYWSTPINSERHLLACSRYIEMNPVRAGLVGEPAQYQWSSYGHNVGGAPDRLITPHTLYESLAADPVERQAAYRALFDEVIPEETLEAFRRGRTGSIIGDDEFRELIEKKVRRSLVRPRRGGDRRSATFRGLKEPSEP
jgi:putative transposase